MDRNSDDEFEDHARALREMRRQRDFDDLQHEMSGIDNGRMKRFLDADGKTLRSKRQERERHRAHAQLMQLLEDPVYREKYFLVMDRLDAVERTTDTLLATIAQDIERAEQALLFIRDAAARLPDGTRVYRDASGNVRREDKTIVDDDRAATILWRGDEPSFEHYLAQADHIAALKSQQQDLTRYRTDVLGDARNRLSDEDEPPSLDELDQIMGNIAIQMPDIVARNTDTQDFPASGSVQNPSITLPELGSKP